MNKMNKKGFTLIEMLFVIAIIAVLVSIIIPTVTSATDKAAAATNAANLRSLVAEATTKMLTADTNGTGNVKLTFKADGTFEKAEVTENAPKSKACGGCTKNQPATLEWDANKGAFVAKYDGFTLDDFAAVAAGEKVPADLKKTS